MWLKIRVVLVLNNNNQTLQACLNYDSTESNIILDKLAALEECDSEQISLNEKLQHELSSHSNKIKALEEQLSSYQDYTERLENCLAAHEKTTNGVTVVPKETYSKPDVRGKHTKK